MKNNGTVRGELKHAVPVVIEKDTVYIHTNIREYDKLDSDGNKIDVGYEYEEIEYDKDEYLQKLIAERADA